MLDELFAELKAHGWDPDKAADGESMIGTVHRGGYVFRVVGEA